MKKLLKKLVPETSPLWLAYHRSKALIAALRYGFPARTLRVIGITGTDGKTTTVGMIAHILNASGKKCGALSTAFLQIGDRVTWNPTQKTSPSPFIVQRFLRDCVAAGCSHAVLEYSSHGLLQGRLNFTWPRVAGITNLSEEHLDYHKTMEAYLQAKSLLFTMLRKTSGVAVLNADDRSFAELRKIPARFHVRYSTVLTSRPPLLSACPPKPWRRREERRGGGLSSSKPEVHTSALWMTDAKTETGNIGAIVHSSTESETFALHIPVAGAFNLSNALCAIGCAHSVNVMLGDCVRALASFTGIPGRMERINAGQSFAVYIDFTVTPQSYEATLSTLKASLQPGARLLVLTGSCGDRMKEKRPIVGSIVSAYADVTVVANEDPYTEDPEKIIDDVWAGIDQTKTEAHRIFDRREAIRFLLKQARKDDIVIFCGKGSDTTMWMKTGQVPWNEREIVMKELESVAPVMVRDAQRSSSP